MLPSTDQLMKSFSESREEFFKGGLVETLSPGRSFESRWNLLGDIGRNFEPWQKL
jgi:hypothetical protein